MNKRQLAERLAKQAHKSRAKAADEVDSLVHDLLKEMKQKEHKPADAAATGAPKPPSPPPATSKAPAKGKS